MTFKTTKTNMLLASLSIMLLIASTTMPAFAIKPDKQSYAPVPIPVINGTAVITATAPYVAAYHDVAKTSMQKAKVTCNFSGTDRSKIQSDNYLTCVESIQNPTGTAKEDWGYQAYVTLKQTGSLIVGADVWKGCEYLPGYPGGSDPCNGTPAGTVEHKYSNSAFITATPSQDVTVFIEPDPSNPRYINWYYQIGTGTKTLYATLLKATEQNNYFNTGNYNTWPIPSPITARYFQAGVGSAYNIGQSGWFVQVKNPSYDTGTGYNTHYAPAKSIEGDQSYWDISFLWGGSVYSGVNAVSSCTPSLAQANFQYTGTTIGNNVQLWGVC